MVTNTFHTIWYSRFHFARKCPYMSSETIVYLVMASVRYCHSFGKYLTLRSPPVERTARDQPKNVDWSQVILEMVHRPKGLNSSGRCPGNGIFYKTWQDERKQSEQMLTIHTVWGAGAGDFGSLIFGIGILLLNLTPYFSLYSLSVSKGFTISANGSIKTRKLRR